MATTTATADTLRAARLRVDVVHLADTIGERNAVCIDELRSAADWIAERLTTLGYEIARLPYQSGAATFENIETVTPVDDARPTLIVGAHYDSVIGSPGADDNASAVAGMLELARAFADTPGALSPSSSGPRLRFVAFVNEEPPFFQTQRMGSLVYARHCRQRGDILTGMICLESIGVYSSKPGTQFYPWPLNLILPDRGDFIGFVSNLKSRRLLEHAGRRFRATSNFPVQARALPATITGIGWSDHWSFWECGWPALMVTDTAPFRNQHYHLATDTPEKLDYVSTACVIDGLEGMLRNW